MKKIYRAMAGIILALLLAIGLASLFTTGVGSDGADTSKPQFSMQALLDGTFISKLETWYTNTFPMRDTLLKANRWLNGFYHSSAGDDNILVLDGNTGAEQGGESLARQEYEKRGRRSKMSRSLRRKRPAMLRLPIRKPEQKRLRRKRRQGRRAAKLIRSRPRNQPRRIRCRSWITPISPRRSTPEMS